MNGWEKIKVDGIAAIEKCVAEFNICGLSKIPYSKFKIKIIESNKGYYNGKSDLQVIDATNSYYCAVGYGKSIEEALENTINNFLEMISENKEWGENEFKFSDSFDF